MIQFQLSFSVSSENAAKFEESFKSVFEPALRVQPGYGGSTLCRVFEPEAALQIQAAETDFNYELVFRFESEQARRDWVATSAHDEAWPALTGCTEKAIWRGYDVVSSVNA